MRSKTTTSDGLGGGAEGDPSAVDVVADEADRRMERYAAGDDTAFAPLYAALAPRVMRFLTRLTGAPHRAADLTQETFLRMHRARGSFAPGSAVAPWAMAIARNAFRDELRRKSHKNERLDDDEELGAIATARSKEPSGEEQRRAREVAQTVQSVLERLPVNQREAFVLLRFEGMSVNEAAEVLDTTPAAVKLRAFRAYEAIRAALGMGGEA
jgi:RNA polymerase sigma-70 factor (ECF subfamily)